MNFADIPDDIWISIFEQIDDDPPTLAVLVRTCRLFHGLAAKLLLRELKWSKPELSLRNIEAWKGVYSDLVPLPRKITIGVPFEFTHVMRQSTNLSLSPDMKLHDLIHSQLLRFSSIADISLVGTVISPYTYSVLGQIPTLRSLHLVNCSFINLHVSFATRASHLFPQESPPCPLQSISSVPIKHLSLHRVNVPSEYENYRYHPLSLLTISTLTSLSITWSANIAARYAQTRWSLPSLTELTVLMPLMSRDLLDELSTFLHKSDLSPKFKLTIDKHNLSDTQMTTVQVPVMGLWNYEGPLVIVAGSATKSLLRPTLTHVRINETLELPPLLDGLEKLPMVMEELDVQVGKWDIELLFAIKELFKKIKRLKVRYVRGGLPENLLVRLGADILFCLPDLISIKLLGPIPQDDNTNTERCPTRSGNRVPSLGSPNTSSVGRIHPRRPISQHCLFHEFHSTVGMIQSSRSDFHDDRDLDFDAEDYVLDREQQQDDDASPFQSSLPWTPIASSSSSRSKIQEDQESSSSDSFEPASPLSQAELGDYLVGWNRYCPSLRMIQIDRRWWWERRFAGDPWALHVVKRSSSNKGKERE